MANIESTCLLQPTPFQSLYDLWSCLYYDVYFVDRINYLNLRKIWHDRTSWVLLGICEMDEARNWLFLVKCGLICLSQNSNFCFLKQLCGEVSHNVSRCHANVLCGELLTLLIILKTLYNHCETWDVAISLCQGCFAFPRTVKLLWVDKMGWNMCDIPGRQTVDRLQKTWDRHRDLPCSKLKNPKPKMQSKR